MRWRERLKWQALLLRQWFHRQALEMELREDREQLERRQRLHEDQLQWDAHWAQGRRELRSRHGILTINHEQKRALLKSKQMSARQLFLVSSARRERLSSPATPQGREPGKLLRFIFGRNAYNRTFLQIYADGNEERQEAEAAKRHREVLMIRFRIKLSLLSAALSIIGNKLNSLLNPFYQVDKKLPPGE